jgi:hypothetical protein
VSFVTVTLDHTIVANNTATTSSPDIDNTVTANWSLVENTSGATVNGANNITGFDPNLDVLADNGGPTQTHAPLPGSLAINNGNPAIASPPANDQRGAPFVRQNGTIDIGAYELQSFAFVVDTATDESDGDYSPGDVSLREALEVTNANPGAETISFAGALSGSTINLVLGQLTISDDVTITGLGASDLAIDGQGASRVMRVTNNATADISGLTITGGSADRGGGLRNYAGSTTELTEVVISGNTATASDFWAGGGIRNEGNLTITDSRITGNATTGGIGGGAGIGNNSVLVIERSTISGNTSVHDGGGVYSNFSGNVTIIDSTLSGNSAGDGGGALYLDGTNVVTGSSISGNMAVRGGGLQLFGTTTISHSTIVDNTATSSGGGIRSNGTVNLDHTIVANNTSPTGPDINGTVTANWSLVENTSGATVNGANNLTGLDPNLGALANNGGPTETHALLPGSPAIHRGDPAAVAGVGTVPLFDQRGAGFDRVVFGRIDIGSYEFDDATLPGQGLVVDEGSDVFDGDFTVSNLSLREAVILANVNAGANTIKFDPILTGATIFLTNGQLQITDDVEINGLGPDDLAIDAGGASRVMAVTNGADAEITGLRLTDGNADRGGGLRNYAGSTTVLSNVLIDGNQASNNYDTGAGVHNAGDLTVTDSRITGNAGTGGSAYGGGFRNTSGAVLSILRSTISGNTARDGGAIYNNGDVTIVDSTLSNNAATDDGGAIYSFGTLDITGSTISGNTSVDSGAVRMNNGTLFHSTIVSNSGGRGGGVHASYGVVTLDHTIVANNTAATGPDINGTVTANWSLVENTTGATINGANNITGLDPVLDVLADNGGPTRTHAVRVGSPALGAGDPAFAGPPNNDQRGAPFVREFGTIDIGAYEAQPRTLVVDTAVDESDGNFAPGDFSLREAIERANGNAGPDVINFAGSLTFSTIFLVLGQLTISDDVTINGLGADDLTIDAQGSSRVMAVTNSADAEISGLRLTDGNADFGSGLRNYAGSTTELTDVVIDSNTATASDYWAGGGIRNEGSLTIIDSRITGNNTTTGIGGGAGIGNNGVLSITRSTISGNSSVHDAGGIYSYYAGDLTITDSTISGNSAGDQGGAIWARATLLITGSTISGNTAVTGGGGVLLAATSATIRHSTIVGNSGNLGGGIRDYYNNAVIDHTIVANNTAPTGPDINGTVTANWSLIENTSGATIGGANNITGVDPMLDVLVNNGGPTQTHALLPGSVARNAGDPGIAGAPANDQRGAPFVRENGTIDIGAYEAQSFALIVDTIVDEDDGDHSALDFTLREALQLSNANPEPDTIGFSGALAGGTISLVLGELVISDDVVITGLGADDLAIDAQDNSRVLSVSAGTTSTISGLTLTGGNAISGGGVYNSGDLTVTDSVIAGNSASSTGGGFYNAAGALLSIVRSTVSGNAAGFGGGVYATYGSAPVSITDSTVSGNTVTSGGGGGVWANGTTLSITSSTISGNSAVTYGGGVLAANGAATIRHSTIVDNSADLGGGIDTYYANTTTIDHTIVANNTATTAGPDIRGNVTVYNSLVENTTDAVIVGLGNITGSDPLLGPLQDNGGPTETHALLPGSPAYDAGDPSFTTPPDYDQRGVNYERVHGARIDIGAYELLLADGNLDGKVDGLDYLRWAANYGDDPADDPPGTPQNGDYNNDGKVDGLDYLLWAGHYGEGLAVVASVPGAATLDGVTSTVSQQELAAVDLALQDDYDTGATVADDLAGQSWRTSSAFDSALEKLSGGRRDQKRVRAAM